jgi:hypothetical protein
MEVDYDGDGVMDCIPCTSSFGIGDIDSKGCSKCPNREMNEDEYCVLKECPKGYIRDTYSDCYSCDVLSDVYVEDGECDNCPNRRMSDYGSCNLVECPDEYLFDAYGQVCRSCDESSSYLVENPDECRKCPNRELEGDNICGIKCLGNYFKNKDNDCIPCDDLDSEEDVTEFQCTKKCDNREIKTTKYGREVCALKECPDRHIVDSYHGCWSCNTKYAFDSSECSDCTDREIITTKYGYEVCALKVCPSGTNRDDDGNCI